MQTSQALKVPVCCDFCGNECKPDDCTTGYGVTSAGQKQCFTCCGKEDRKSLENAAKGDRFAFYLVPVTAKDKQDDRRRSWTHKLTNWPGSFVLGVTHVRKGRHNIARTRYDFWITFADKSFHGVQYGENSQIAHVRCLG